MSDQAILPPQRFALGRLFMNIMTSATFERFDLAERNRIIFLNAVSYAGVVTMFVFSAIAFANGRGTLALSTLSTGVLVLCLLVLMRRFVIYRAAGWLITLLMGFFYGYLVWSGGEQGSGILWIQSFPLIAMFLINALFGTVISVLFLVFVVVTMFMPDPEHLRVHFTADYAYRVIGTYAYVWLYGLTYDLIRRYTQNNLLAANTALSRTMAELTFEKQQTDGILSNVKEGICLMDKDYRIGSSHSAFMREIFERDDLAGLSFLEVLEPVLAERDLEATRDWLPMLYATNVNPVLIAEINPLAEARAEFFDEGGKSREKYLRFGFKPVSLRAGETSILVVVRDVTEEVQLQKKLDEEAQRHRQSMEKLFQVIHVEPAMMTEFVRDTEAELDGINTLLRDRSTKPSEIMPHMFQAVHGIKGNALLLGLNELARKVHELEDQVKPFLEKDCSWKELLGLTLGMGMIQTELEEINQLIGKILGFQKSSSEHGLSDRPLLERTLSRLVDREGQRIGKPVRLVFDGFDSRGIPEIHRKLAKDVLVQLLRNSLAHGLESPAERQRAGKPAEGTISLSMTLAPGVLRFACRDDGKGLDLLAIRQKAAGLPGMNPEILAGMKAGDLAMLIFNTGFSTAAAEDMAAGRGAGLALVKARVEGARGKVFLRTKPGVYCEIGFQLPVELS
jgi:signal transduction histidine kinase